MTEINDLLPRIRAALGDHRPIREVNMFGGICLMVNEQMLLCVMSHSDLLVRTDPERSVELLALDGARQAEMGAGRSMGKSWITVTGEAVATDETLNFWVDEALTYNATATRPGGRRRSKKKP